MANYSRLMQSAIFLSLLSMRYRAQEEGMFVVKAEQYFKHTGQITPSLGKSAISLKTLLFLQDQPSFEFW